MKLNISYPANGSQKLIEIDDERKLRAFMEKRMGAEVPGDALGDEFKGYVGLPSLFYHSFCNSTFACSEEIGPHDEYREIFCITRVLHFKRKFALK